MRLCHPRLADHDEAGVQAEGDEQYIRDGVIVLPKNAILPDGTVI